MITVDGNWIDPLDNSANIEWVRETWRQVGRFGKGSTYLNFTGIADEDTTVGVDDAFGPNVERLAEVKAKYDPENFFRLNNNIAPAS
jgi:hypothetical protein